MEIQLDANGGSANNKVVGILILKQHVMLQKIGEVIIALGILEAIIAVKKVAGIIIQILLVLVLLELIVNGNIILAKKKIVGLGILQIQVLVLIIV